MPQDIAKSYSYRAVGIVLVIVGFVGVVVVTQHKTMPTAHALLWLPIWIACVVGGGILARRGRKHALPSADVVMQTDHRPPILYLRSFLGEEGEYSVGNFFESWFAPIIPGTSMPWGPREQEELAKYMQLFGPYIAIGRPGEHLPEFGAARMYVPNDKWQKVVGELMDKAAAVVVQAGRTHGLAWELGALIQRNRPTRILLIVPRSQGAYDEFRQWANPVLPKALPEGISKSRLIAFRRNWEPYALEPAAGLLWTLKPFFDLNGMPFPKGSA